MRNWKSVSDILGLVGSGSSSFPLVLGRDVSGTVVDSGGDAKSGF